MGPYKALCHPYFDELRNGDVELPNGKELPKHLFEFQQCEIDYDKDLVIKTANKRGIFIMAADE